MGSVRMFWLLFFTLSFIFNHPAEAANKRYKPEKHLSSAIVIGTVYCDTCFQQDFSKASHFISGASVAVACGTGTSRPSFYKEVTTNEHGEFKVHLPFAVSKHVKRIKRCSVKLLRSSEPYCAVASSATSSSVHLKARKPGTHIFSAGFFTFKPLKEPELCNQKPDIHTSNEFSSSKDFVPLPSIPNLPVTPLPDLPVPNLPSLPPMIPDPTMPTLPPLTPLPPIPTVPTLPPLTLLPPIPTVPTLPPLTPLPPIPKPLKNTKTSPNHEQQNQQFQLKETESLTKTPVSDVKTFSFFPPIIPPVFPSPPPTFGGVPLPPNPFQPPPLLPNPLMPPPSTGLPLMPPSTGLPPLIPTLPTPILPPIPVLTPPPPPPAFPFPIPPLPFLPPPFPGIPFPGIPPASASKRTSP